MTQDTSPSHLAAQQLRRRVYNITLPGGGIALIPPTKPEATCYIHQVEICNTRFITQCACVVIVVEGEDHRKFTHTALKLMNTTQITQN